VVSESYPSGFRCYYGQDLSANYIDACTTTTVVGEYSTRKQAIRAAIAERDDSYEFHGWAEDFYEDQGPPFNSIDGENYDDDDCISIYIVDIAKDLAVKEKVMAEARKKFEKARSATKAAKKPRLSTDDSPFFGYVEGSVNPDNEIFIRNPSRIPGGKTRLPGAYTLHGRGRASFVYLIQRLSDRNYCMRNLCLDENAGAYYSSFKLRNVKMLSMAWRPQTNLEDHVEDKTIFDAFHTDLFHPKNGRHSLTADVLLKEASSKIECLFLTNFRDSGSLEKAIRSCPNLKCVT